MLPMNRQTRIGDGIRAVAGDTQRWRAPPGAVTVRRGRACEVVQSVGWYKRHNASVSADSTRGPGRTKLAYPVYTHTH